MESMQELIPFAKELLSQKPTRNLLKVYMLGSVFALLHSTTWWLFQNCHYNLP
uniref:Uncharacterized protein n=1 Tax=Kryptolebias marmoratus TaxID=37003 RepID=A0A3Q3B7H3_KRYMA